MVSARSTAPSLEAAIVVDVEAAGGGPGHRGHAELREQPVHVYLGVPDPGGAQIEDASAHAAGPGAPTQAGPRLEDLDVEASGAQAPGRGEAGDTGADDGDVDGAGQGASRAGVVWAL